MSNRAHQEKIAALLAAATEAQQAYWGAVRELEEAAGVEFDGEDLSALSAEDVMSGERPDRDGDN